MTSFYKALFFSFILLCSSTPSFAARSSFSSSSDMFYNQHWVYDRPQVRSDWDRGSDMFPNIPPMYHENADVFDRVKPPYTYGREDMFPHRSEPLQRPQTVLTIDPPQGVYDVR